MPLKLQALDRAVQRVLTDDKFARARRTAFDGLPVGLRSVVRRALQGEALLQRQPHLLSVVVPVYNVEEYLAECLRSIVNQSYSRLEIIVVDDGSTDGSLDIARAVARRDRRVKIVRQENAGLGAARNAGMRLATGDFLVFADSDDVIPPNAYRAMLRTLDLTGSDFVVGAYYRMSETNEYLPPWLEELHEEERLGIQSGDFTAGLANVFAWNKMFRASFIDRIELQFPEGIRYEDQYPMTRAYLLADAFDVIPEIVYKWRIRFDGTSITQNKRAFDDVRDRVEVVKSVYTYVKENADQDFFDAWVSKVLSMDLIPYVSETLHANEEYRERVRELVHLLSDHITPSIREKLDVRTSATLYVLEHGTVEDLGHVMLTHSEIWQHLPTRVKSDGTVVFTPTYPEAVSVTVPTELLELGEDELRTDHGLNRLSWANGTLALEGWGLIRHIDLAPGELPVARVYWHALSTGAELDCEVEGRPQFVSRWYNSRWPDYDAAGFHASVDAEGLAEFATEHGTLELRMRIESHGRQRDIAITNIIENGSAGARESFVSAQGDLISLLKPRGHGLRLKTTQVHTVVDALREADGRLEIDVLSRPKGSPAGTAFTRQTMDEGSAESRFAGRGRKKNRQPQSVHVRHAALPTGIAAGERVLAQRSRKGKFLWRPGASGAMITAIRLDSEVLVVSGTAFGSRSSTLAFESELHVIPAESVIWDGHDFEARLPLRIDEFGHSRLAPYDGYRLVYREGKKSQWLRPTQELHDRLPVDTFSESYRLRLTRTRLGAVWFDLSYPSSDEVTGSLGQAKLQRWHQTADLEPIPDSVFFQSYLGEQATDSALALHSELRSRFPEMKLYWGVVDRSVAVPEGAIPVVRYTQDWYEKISRAQYLVNNIYFFSWFMKRPFQTYVQTWHGTPLKKIGRSYWEDRRREPIWISRMDRQAASWDYLVSPNAFCTEKFAEEFRYSGTVLETGYPRNDVLAQRQQDADQVRDRLGISRDKKVVLYAPTWRDNKSAQAWVADFVVLLDLQKLSAELGEDYVILVRGHGHNARAGSTVGSSGQVIDVTYYPEINDLYLAADLAITDYSSVMFDFAVTRKPLLFFAPDLVDYAQGVRGFYFDYEELVPGPVLQDQTRVAESIRELTSPEWQPNARYTAFVERFCALEDGNAAARVVDRVWGA